MTRGSIIQYISILFRYNLLNIFGGGTILELVYLWVEDYKNIKKQGFNFSPQFSCEFKDEYEKYTDEEGNEKERLKDNCELIICDKKKNECKDNDYIQNFFGDNINVTAIVGKNGSGKSGLIGILDDINILDKKDKKIISIISLDNSLYYSSTFLIKTNLEKYISNFEYMSYNAENPYPYLEREKYHLYYDIEIDDEFDRYMDNDEVGEYDSRYIEITNSKDKIITFEKRQLLLKNIHKSMLDINVTSFMLVPYKFTILNFNIKAFYVYIEEKLKKNNFDSFGLYFVLKDIKDYIYDTLLYQETLFNLLLLDFFLELKIFSDFLEKVKKFYGEEELELLDFMDYIKIYYDDNQKKIGKLPQEIYFILDNEEFIISTIPTEVKNKLFIDYSDFIILDYEDKKHRKFSDLSHGEKSIYALMLNIQYKIINSEENNFIFCLDEPDLSLHPEWQRKFLYEFLTNIVYENRYIHFILTTHSPFLLSDILKQNIIFLDKDDDGNCKVVDGLKEKKQTFGANIHTLLSDSFFMEDGLMGEFARDKIDKVINYLNQKKLSEDELKYCEQIISIIGEPIVKNQLQRMLDSKRLKKVDRIDSIEKTIEDLQKQLKELKK